MNGDANEEVDLLSGTVKYIGELPEPPLAIRTRAEATAESDKCRLLDDVSKKETELRRLLKANHNRMINDVLKVLSREVAQHLIEEAIKQESALRVIGPVFKRWRARKASKRK